MRRGLVIPCFLLVASAVYAQTPGASAGGAAPLPVPELQKKVESFMRKLFAWGPTFQVKVGTPAESGIPELYRVDIEVTVGDQSDTGTVYISKDGRHLLQGQLHDTAADPFAANRALIRLQGAPSKGPANAKVTVVEFSDFQCPHCRELYLSLKAIEPLYPQVRFVFKDLPLGQIHPWAEQAAIAGRCAFQQNSDAFWKLHDYFFEKQDLISAESIWQTILDSAAAAGLDLPAFRTCMTSPEVKAAIQASVNEAQALRIANTPTVFINGRRLVGGDRAMLEQYINYELAPGASAPAPQQPRPTVPKP